MCNIYTCTCIGFLDTGLLSEYYILCQNRVVYFNLFELHMIFSILHAIYLLSSSEYTQEQPFPLSSLLCAAQNMLNSSFPKFLLI